MTNEHKTVGDLGVDESCTVTVTGLGLVDDRATVKREADGNDGRPRAVVSWVPNGFARIDVDRSVRLPVAVQMATACTIRERLEIVLTGAMDLKRETVCQNIPPTSVNGTLQRLMGSAHELTRLPWAGALEVQVKEEFEKLPKSLSAFDELGGFAGVAATLDRLIPVIGRAHDAARAREKSLR